MERFSSASISSESAMNADGSKFTGGLRGHRRAKSEPDRGVMLCMVARDERVDCDGGHVIGVKAEGWGGWERSWREQVGRARLPRMEDFRQLGCSE